MPFIAKMGLTIVTVAISAAGALYQQIPLRLVFFTIGLWFFCSYSASDTLSQPLSTNNRSTCICVNCQLIMMTNQTL